MVNNKYQIPKFRDRAFALAVIFVTITITGVIFYYADPKFTLPSELYPAASKSAHAFGPREPPDYYVTGYIVFILSLFATPIFICHLISNNKWWYLTGITVSASPFLVVSIMCLTYGGYFYFFFYFALSVLYATTGITLYRLTRRLAAFRAFGVPGIIQY